jgi:Domain of unknown function (DUF4145)
LGNFFRLHEAEKVAEKLPPLPTEQAPPTPEETKGFAAIAKLSPRAAILEMRANLDEAVRSFAEAVGMDTKSEFGGIVNAPLGMLIRDLRQHSLIDSKTSEILDHLRIVGNTTAHGRGNPTEEDAIRFGQLAERLISQFEIGTGAAKMGPPGPIPPGLS